MITNNTEFIIGPLTYTHTVQKIAVQERKAVSVLEATRTSKNFVVDSGESDSKAQIRFLFTGLDEINTGVGKEQSGLRGLIALFRACPIVSIKNKYLSTLWKKQDTLYDEENYKKITEYLATVTELNKVIEPEDETSFEATEINARQYYNEQLLKKLNSSLSVNSAVSIPSLFDSVKNIDTTDFSFIASPLDPNFLKANRYYSSIVPIAMEKLELENVPDLPYCIQATLTISRVDISPVSDSEVLHYMDIQGGKTDNPKEAYWLKRWIEECLSLNIVKEITKDITGFSITWTGIDSLDKNLAPKNNQSFELATSSTSASNALLLSENCSISHKFAYNKLLGKTSPTPSHMGSTSRYLSLDIVFNNQKGYKTFEEFTKFKETADQINKSLERKDRTVGWALSSPISKLLTYDPENKEAQGLFVPMYVFTETGDQPDMINCRIDLVENNTSFIKNSEISFSNGGADYQLLKTFYDKVVAGEYKFRQLLTTSRESAIDQILNESNDSDYSMYSLFWPIEKGIVNLKKDSSFGILNGDTLRATLMSEYLDPNQNLKQALLKSALATGQVVANRRLNILEKISLESGVLYKGITGVDAKGTEEAAIYAAIRNTVSNTFIIFEGNAQEREELIDKLTTALTVSYLGNNLGTFGYTSATNSVLSDISKSKYKLHPTFVDALFNTIIDRKPKDKNLPYVYSTDGVYSAFYKLITKYTLIKDSTITQDEARKELINSFGNKHSSNYPDLLLPTYKELYGDLWEDFAPTIDDLGIDTYTDQRDVALAVQEDDYVHPSAWFYTKRNKKDLRTIAREAVTAVNKSSPDFSLSMPFNTEDLEVIREALERKKNNVQGSPEHTVAVRTLSEVIERSLTEYSKSNPSGFREDYVTLASRFEGKTYSGNDTIKLYIHHNGSYVLPREVNIPGLGAEIYRVLGESKLLKSNGLARLDADSVYTTPVDKEIKFHRHLDENTQACVDSCIDQIPDDQFSVERLFPAVKIYLLENRGNDLIADDTLFNLSNILSIDITMDKQDAPLAVIKLADPLYLLQSDYFNRSNSVRVDKTNKRVLYNLKDPDKDSFAKRYKIVQGRSVQIRMGYGSMAYNLPIVFTGRISEIVPGDQLTLVCQGWKAELINRQVNFYNDDPKNWGARDLAIQAITYASPEGFGDYYPQHDLNFILKNLNPEDITQAIQNSLSNGQNIDLDGVGTRTVSQRLTNWASRLIGLSSTNKNNRGLDTRLKNIWYPDTSFNYNNLFGLRSKFSVMPSWHNDSWIVPLQPCWDVLQEASRHAWNCIVDVVPFDTKATIFMGHPDQPYVYTSGNALSKAYYNKHKKTKINNLDKKINQLIDLFISSKYYSTQGAGFLQFLVIEASKQLTTTLGNKRVSDEATSQLIREILQSKLSFDFTSFDSYESLVNSVANLNEGLLDAIYGLNIYEEAIIEILETSNLPAAVLDKVKDTGDYPNIPLLLFSKFFNIPEETLLFRWPTIDRDLPEILSRDRNYLESNILGSLKSTSNNIQSIKYYYEKLSSKRIANLVTPMFSAPGLQVEVINVMNSAVSELTNPFLREVSALYKELSVGIKAGPNNSSLNEAIKEKYIQLDQLLDRFLGILKEEIDRLEQKNSTREEFRIKNSASLEDTFKENYLSFKAFVYFFCLFLLEDEDIKKQIGDIGNDLRQAKKLPPDMKVFRVHHFISDANNIIQNTIVATTREMWNTVVIEHPAPGTAESQINDTEELYSKGRINAGANWVYYPKQEVTGVIGLQFNPALTLSNKKIKVFTELNCQNPDLAAKLACGHLAEGIRKMYRGNIKILGKNIKPHDRLIIADAYTKITGPVEVESLVHHWNVDQGWITNIIPNAVCDANPGAAILHTAALETTYQAIFNGLEFVSDALTYATIIATLGAATPLALGQFSVRKGLLGVIKRFNNKGVVKALGSTLKAHVSSIKKIGGSTWNNLKGVFKSGERFNLIKGLVKDLGGPGMALLKNELLIGAAEFSTHMFFKANVISGFVQNSNDVEQLPVILSPLIFNNTVFTAGLETDDSVWAISSFGLFYSMRQMQQGISLVLDDLFRETL